MKYQPPFGDPNVIDPNASYVNGDPRIGLAGSIAPAAMMEFPQREIVNAIIGGGLEPDDGDLDQLDKVIKRSSKIYVIDQGTPNSIIVNPVPTLLAYLAGNAYEVRVAGTNTGPVIINVSGLGARSLVRLNGSPLVAGDIVAGGIALVVYDGINFQLLTSASAQFTEESQVHYGVDTGVTNAMVATVQPGIDGLRPGLFCLIAASHTNTGPVTINIQGLGVKSIVRASGASLSAGDIVVGAIAEMAFDGTNFELLNVQVTPGGGGTSLDESIAGPLRPYFIAVNSATTTAPPSSPLIGDTYCVPAGATGLWSGLDNQISQYAGPVRGWVTVNFPTQSMIGIGDQDDFWKRTGSGWRTIFASIAECNAGTSNSLAVTPLGLQRFKTIVGPIRPYFISVISRTVTAPPGSPAIGATYLVPGGATGAWSGFVDYLAQWDGTQWLFESYPATTMIGVGDQDDWFKKMPSSWRTAYASLDEALQGTSTTTIINPADLAYVLAHLPSGDDAVADLLFYGSF